MHIQDRNRILLYYEHDWAGWQMAGLLCAAAVVLIAAIPLLFRLFSLLQLGKAGSALLAFGLPLGLAALLLFGFSRKGTLLLDRSAGQLTFNRLWPWRTSPESRPLSCVTAVRLVTVRHYDPGHSYYVALSLQVGSAQQPKVRRIEISDPTEDRGEALDVAKTLAAFLSLPIQEEDKWEPSL